MYSLIRVLSVLSGFIPALLATQKLVIGGLFPIHEKSDSTGANGPCGKIMERRGVQRAEAMLYAIDQINQNRFILPTFRLEAMILDTCADPIYALNQSLAFVRNIMNIWQIEQACEPIVPGTAVFPVTDAVPKPIAGVIGESYSEVTIQTANLLKLFEIVQISPASTTATLSDKNKYYYFARTVAPDSYQARALADVARNFNWTYVSLVYSTGEYGENGAEEFKRAAKSLQICIALEEKITDGHNLDVLLRNLLSVANKDGEDSQVGARVVVLFTRNDDTRRLLTAANRVAHRPDYKLIWLAADGWETSSETTAGLEDVAVGVITTVLKSERIGKFESHFKQLHPLKGYGNKRRTQHPFWFQEFWEQHFKCKYPTIENVDSPIKCDFNTQTLAGVEDFDEKIEFVIDAVYSLAFAIDHMWKNVCRPYDKGKDLRTPCKEMDTFDRNLFGKRLYKDFLMNVSFTGSSGKEFKYDSHGDGPAEYFIMNLQRNLVDLNYSYVNVGSWTSGVLDLQIGKIWWAHGTIIPPSRCSSDCPIGFVKGIQAGETCCWMCTMCRDNEYLASETQCEKCEPGCWPEADKSKCFNIVDKRLEVMQWNSWYTIFPSLLSGLGILFTLMVIRTYIAHSDTPVIKASGRELSHLLLIGILICYLMTYVVLLRPTPISCAVKRVGIGFGFAFLYSALLVKTNRIFRIFSSARRGAGLVRFISPVSQVIFTCLLSSVQLVATAIWLILSPPTTRYDYPDPQPQVILKCSVEDQLFLVSLVYDMWLIIACTVYAVKTRMVPENFNETKFIGFTMYTTCIIWLAFVPIYFGTGNNFKVQTTTLCVSISLSASVALICLFSPKMWVVYMEPDKNTRKPGLLLSSNDPTSTHYQFLRPSMITPLIPKNIIMPRAPCGYEDSTFEEVCQMINYASVAKTTNAANCQKRRDTVMSDMGQTDELITTDDVTTDCQQ